MSAIGHIDDTFTFYAVTTRFDTGAATDADAVPAYRVYEEETGTAILTGNMALLDSSNTAGLYSEQITLSAANGFEVGKRYGIYISATVNSVAGATHRELVIRKKPLTPTTEGRELDVTATGAAGVDWGNVENPTTTVALSGTTTGLIDNAITAAKIAADAITAAKIASDAITAAKIAADAIGSSELADSARDKIVDQVLRELLSDHAGVAGSLAAAIDAMNSLLAARLVGTIATGTHNPQSGDGYGILNSGTHGNAALKTLIDDVPTNAELAASQAAADDATLAAIAALNNLSAAQVNAEVDAAIETYHLDHLLAADYDPANKPGVSTALLNELIENDGGVSRYTANALEQAPSGAGSDPWATSLPGSYTSGQAGNILGNRLDVAVSSISSAASPQLLQTTTIATLTSQTVFTLTAGSADNDAYNLGSTCIAIITDQATATQKAAVRISDYVGGTRQVTLASAPAFTIAVGDAVSIVAVGDNSNVVSLLAASEVTVTSPVADDGALTLYNHRTYDGTAHALLSFTVSKDYSSASGVRLEIHPKDDPDTELKSATAVVASSTLITVDLDVDFGASLTFDGCPLVCEVGYALVADYAGGDETIATGKAYVYDQPA